MSMRTIIHVVMSLGLILTGGLFSVVAADSLESLEIAPCSK